MLSFCVVVSLCRCIRSPSRQGAPRRDWFGQLMGVATNRTEQHKERLLLGLLAYVETGTNS